MARRRIALVHAYRHSMPPLEAAFAADWPEVEVVNLLDEALYADVDASGVAKPGVGERLASLFRHCAASGADAALFTGTTFGRLVDAARQGIAIPVLKADEAMAEEAVASGRPLVLLCTAARAIPVIEENLRAAAGSRSIEITLRTQVVDGAKAAISDGDMDRHDRLIAEAACRVPQEALILLGQASMVPALSRFPAALAARSLNSPAASVRRLRRMLEPAG